MMKTLNLEPLTASAFSPFGNVIEAECGTGFLINEGTTRRFHALAKAEPGVEGEAIVSIFRAVIRPRPIAIRMLERHPLGAQAFLPMERHPWIVVVADRPDASACRAFLARGDQGVQYTAGVWHHPLLTLQSMQDFVVVDRQGPGENLEENWFADGEFAEIALV